MHNCTSTGAVPLVFIEKGHLQILTDTIPGLCDSYVEILCAMNKEAGYESRN